MALATMASERWKGRSVETEKKKKKKSKWKRKGKEKRRESEAKHRHKAQAQNMEEYTRVWIGAVRYGWCRWRRTKYGKDG